MFQIVLNKTLNDRKTSHGLSPIKLFDKEYNRVNQTFPLSKSIQSYTAPRKVPAECSRCDIRATISSAESISADCTRAVHGRGFSVVSSSLADCTQDSTLLVAGRSLGANGEQRTLDFAVLGVADFLPRPALRGFFRAVELHLFLNAICFSMFVHGGHGTFRLGAARKLRARG